MSALRTLAQAARRAGVLGTSQNTAIVSQSRSVAPAALCTQAGEENEPGGLGTVEDVLATKGEKFYSTREDAFVIDAVKEMVRHNIGSLIIVNAADKPVGIVTERDYMEKVIVRGRSSHNTLVKDIMSEKTFTFVTPNASLTECMEKMAAMKIRHVPVIEDGKVLGLVSVGDIVRELVAAHKKNAEYMRSFISGSY